jgi:hypothetical protein
VTTGRWVEEPFGAVCADCGAENDLAYRWDEQGGQPENPAKFLEAICPPCRVARQERDRAIVLDPLRMQPARHGRELH